MRFSRFRPILLMSVIASIHACFLLRGTAVSPQADSANGAPLMLIPLRPALTPPLPSTARHGKEMSAPTTKRPETALVGQDSAADHGPLEPAPVVLPSGDSDGFSSATQSLRDTGRAAAGAIDQQLRIEAGVKPAILRRNSPLARAIQSAYVGGPTTVTELQLNDGRRVTRVSNGRWSYCASTESNGLVGARDVFRGGVGLTYVNCPSEQVGNAQ